MTRKYAAIENIRLNATPVINELEILLDIYDKEHNEHMYKKTMVLLTALNNYIIDTCQQNMRES